MAKGTNIALRPVSPSRTPLNQIQRWVLRINRTVDVHLTIFMRLNSRGEALDFLLLPSVILDPMNSQLSVRERISKTLLPYRHTDIEALCRAIKTMVGS